MHEWVLAEAVIAFLQKCGMRRVRRVELRIGELQQIDMDVFIDALHNIAAADERFACMEIICETEHASFKCRSCGNEWDYDEDAIARDEEAAEEAAEDAEDVSEAIHFIPELVHAFSRCPACGCPDFDIIGGRGVLVERIEGECDEG